MTIVHFLLFLSSAEFWMLCVTTTTKEVETKANVCSSVFSLQHCECLVVFWYFKFFCEFWEPSVTKTTTSPKEWNRASAKPNLDSVDSLSPRCSCALQQCKLSLKTLQQRIESESADQWDQSPFQVRHSACRGESKRYSWLHCNFQDASQDEEQRLLRLVLVLKLLLRLEFLLVQVPRWTLNKGSHFSSFPADRTALQILTLPSTVKNLQKVR